MSLDDNDFSDFRHLFPRLIEAATRGVRRQCSHFNLASLRGRTPHWPAAEFAVVHHLVDALWNELLDDFPARVGLLLGQSHANRLHLLV